MLSMVVGQSTTSSTYGSPAPSTTIDVNFLSSGVTDEYVRVSAMMASMPSGQNAQPSLNLLSSSSASVQSAGNVSTIYPTTAGVVNSKFIVSLTSANQLSAGTYVLVLLANTSTTPETLRQNITFTISAAPTPVLSTGLSRVWMMSGTTRASESNYSNSISAAANVNTSTPVANISVDLRDTNNSPITNLPIVAAVAGPGLISIGASPGANLAIGRASLGQAGQYSISLFSDGTVGTSTISIYQNGQLIGTKAFTFTAVTPVAPSISISNVSLDNYSVVAGESVYVRFSASSTSLPYGLVNPTVSILYGEDCEDENCGVSESAELVSGDSSAGTWSVGLDIPSTSLSGNYVLTIFFGKNKGTPGAYYKHSQTITVSGIAPPTVAPAATVSMSGISLSKTKLSSGDSLVIRLSIKSTNLPTEVPLQATIFDEDECEDERCSSYGTGKLVSGTLTNGTWEVIVPIHSELVSGTYSINYGFFKLKGTSGAIRTMSDAIVVSGIPPITSKTTIQFFNFNPTKSSVRAGDVLDVQFDLKTTGVSPADSPQVFLSNTTGEPCADGCGLGYAKLVKGSISGGSWVASISIPNSVRSGNYKLIASFPKFKGVSGSDVIYSGTINVLGVPVLNPAYIFTSTKISQTSLKIGQNLIGNFFLKTNDDTVSTPACIIDGIVGWTKATLTEGYPTDGYWECRITIPPSAVSGTYKVQAAVVGYANDNKNEQWANLGNLVISGISKDTIFVPTPIDDEPIEDDGVEEDPTGNLKVKKESTGKYLLSVSSNLEDEDISIVATKKGSKAIRFSVATKANGSIQIRTTRNLSGYSLKLIFEGQTLKTTKVA